MPKSRAAKHSQHLFSQIPAAQIPRSVFDRSHNYKTTFNAGYLVPFYVDEVLPGDSFKCDCTLFARLATPIVPFMDNMYIETFSSLYLIGLSGTIGRLSMVNRRTQTIQRIM